MSVVVFASSRPDSDYGGSFYAWLFSDHPQPYYSWGNGSAMRVSPVGWAFDTREDVLREAQRSAEISHNHPEGIKGAQAVALAILLCRGGASKEQLRAEIAHSFGYDLDRTVDEIRPGYTYDVSCQGTVPEAITSFLDSASWEDAVRNAVSLGGDADTLACIAGAIAEAFYGPLPSALISQVKLVLPAELWDIAARFCARHVSGSASSAA